MKWKFLLVAACAVLAIPPQVTAMAGGDAAAGQAVYLKSCKVCHGATGEGNPAVVKSSKGALQDLASKEVQSRTDEQMAKDIAGGTAQKKPIKPLTDQQMKDVIAFVRTMAKK